MRHIALALLVSALALPSAAFADELDRVQPGEETIAIADQVGVDALDLQGAINTTRMDSHTYLIAVGLLAAPILALPHVVNTGWPIGGTLGNRIYCVEEIESTHGQHMYNPQGWPPPYYNEHAQGWLGFLPSTARRWGAAIGDRVSEWNAAARMIGAGAGGQFAGIAWGRC